MNIDDLIDATNNEIIQEDKNDIENVISEFNGKKYDCIKCKLCGITSGTLKIIGHTYLCKYNKNNLYGPFISGDLNKKKDKFDNLNSIGILQREYGIINKNSSKQIIGSYGAGPCIILCMRNRNTTETYLAHIDSLTLKYLELFMSNFPPKYTDVYIVGGNDLSKKQINILLINLNFYKYTIKYAYIFDDNTNNFAINCITGDFYINDEINPKIDLPLIFENNLRMTLLMTVYIKKSELYKVNII
tara:strand:- start:463 stop:1197 length:735 start_codon:yes stop_codon:yes gene_type:complete